MLDIDMKLYGIENPRYNPDLKNIPEVIETMRDQIKELFGDNSTLFRGVTDYDLVSLSVTLSDLIWEYNFYKHKAKLKFDPDIIKLLRTNFTLINELFNDLIITRMNTIKLLKIPNLIDQPIFSHPLDIFPFLYLQQFQHSIKDFFSWYQYTFNFISDTVSPVTVLGPTASNGPEETSTNNTEVSTTTEETSTNNTNSTNSTEDSTTGASTVTEGNTTPGKGATDTINSVDGEETGTVGPSTVTEDTVTEEEINTMTMIINDDIKNILENLMEKLSLIINGKYPLAIEEIGGYRPYIKFELEDSENPSSIKGYHKKYADRQLEFEQIEDIITPEVKEKFKEIQEEFKMFKHMSLKDLSLHYCKKFNSEYNFAHRIIKRYNILKSISPVTVLGQTDRVLPGTDDSSTNSTNSSKDISTVGASTVTEGKGDRNTKDSIVSGTEETPLGGFVVGASTVTEDVITEFEKKLLDIITCLNYHIMNIRHMSWFVECSNSLPIECLANLKQTKQNIANPKPKTIFFFSHNFPKAFNTILEFIIPSYYNNNLKIHYNTVGTVGTEGIEVTEGTQSTNNITKVSTDSSKDIGTIGASTVTEGKVTKSIKGIESIIYRKRILEEVYNMSKKRIDRSYEDTFPIGMDEDYKLKDIDLLRDLIDIGAGFKIYSDMPFTGYPMDILIDPDITDELRHSAYFKLAQSQPKPIYKCKNCNYLVFGNRVRLRRSRKIVCYEFEELRDDPKYTCRNCGLGRKQFDVIYRTGEKKYQLPPYIHLEQSPKFTNKRLK
uniref:Uncharacterized protein n=1 Tax=Theileria annulata TaxID=5874 RepID=A0A3B0NC41_THEAN